MDKRSLTLQDLIRCRQAGGFVGRRAQLDSFEESLGLPVEDPRRRFLFSVHGDAGVGKTYLLHQLVRLAREHGYVTACVNEDRYDVLETMEAIVDDLERQGVRCKEFRKQLSAYWQRRSELDGDPGAPEKLSSLLTQSAVRIGLRAAGDVPFVGAVAEEVNPDVVASQVDRLRVFLTRKFRNHSEVRRLMAPVEALTPVFLAEIAAVAGRCPVALFFDTYERTSSYLEGWLLNLLAGRHGNLPGNLILTISGQRPLEVNRWGEYLGFRADLGLEVFTDAEARQLLSDRGVTDETVVEAILDQSGRLPLDVATLAQARPQDASAVGDPSGSTVERFLKWEPDPQRRMAAQHAALPRRLDQEIFAVATGSPAPSEDFAWLCHLSFVAEHTEGFQYHDIVRTRMLRVLRRGAPGEWQQRHTTLADHYQSLRDALGLSGRDAWRDDRWQNLALEEHYHRLCAHTASALPAAKAGLIDALAWHEASVPRWTQMIEQAGRDTKANTVVTCGERLSQWCAQDTDSQLCILSDLAADTTLDDHHRSIAYDERGVIYEKLDRYEEAVADFTRAIGLNPEYQWAFVNRGKTNLLMDRYEEAVTDFTRAISLGSTFEAVIASRGMAYQAMGRHEEALTDFIRVIELNPASEWAFFNRGMTYFLMDRYGEGLADLILAIKLNPKYQLAIIMRGLAYQEMGRYEEALVDLSLAIRLDPKDWWAIANRGVTYRLMGRYEEALVDLSLAIRLDPKVRWAIANRGVTYRLMGRYEDALADLNQAIDLDPKDELALVTLVNRGVTYRLMGRYEEALESLRLAIVLDESESGWAYYQMALVSLARDCAHDARQQLQRALDVKREQILTSQGDGQRRFDVAVYLMALGARDEAQEQVRESLEQDARIADILEAIRNFKDLQVATGSDVSEILCALRTSLHRLQEDEPPTAPRCH